jgi:spermidine synthase
MMAAVWLVWPTDLARVGGVKPYVQLAEARLEDGTLFSLHRHDDRFYLKYNGLELMSTSLTFSEQQLAELGCERLAEGKKTRPACPRVLIGGLGMGFTLKRVLELVGSPAQVDVAELVPEIIEWNRTFLVEHNGPLMEDPRTNVRLADLFDCLPQRPEDRYDAILIDIDDTPEMLITQDNSKLYTQSFLARLKASLNPGGCLAYWLGAPLPRFIKALKQAGFSVEETKTKPHERSKQMRHRIYLARPH